MKRTIFLIGMILVLAYAATVSAQTSLEHRPLDPKTDPDIDMFMDSWKNSIPFNTHGSITERAILSPLDGADPAKPARKGNVLSYAKRFSRGTIDAMAKTAPTTLDGEQEVFYIHSGMGKITTSTTIADLHPGVFVLVPEGKEFTIESTCPGGLEMYIICEPVPAGFTPNPDILVKDEKDIPYRDAGYLKVHWSHNGKNIFNPKDGLAALEAVNMLTFNALTVGQPHSHSADQEEVWTVVDGRNLAFLGKEIRWQEPGTAYKIPPTGKVPHSNINLSEEPVKFLFFARWKPLD